MENIINKIIKLAEADKEDTFLQALNQTEWGLPYVSISKDKGFGGSDTLYLMSLSWQPKSEWKNNIFQNSDHARMHIRVNPDGTGDIEKITGWRTPKFRKTKFKNASDAISKLKKWLELGRESG